VTGYTPNRGYPFPSSERETGNGAAATEVFARAVAADLDVIDAGWATELQHSTIVLTIASDLTPLGSGGLYGVSMDTVVKLTAGVGLKFSGAGIGVATDGDGWYHITGQCHSKANGTITAGAQHRVQLEHLGAEYGGFVTKRMYYSESFQAGSLDMYTTIEAVVHLVAGDEVRMRFFHTNTGSDARVVVAGTRLTGTLIVSDS